MVGGVNPKKAGTEHLGLPVFGTVKEVSTRIRFILVWLDRRESVRNVQRRRREGRLGMRAGQEGAPRRCPVYWPALISPPQRGEQRVGDPTGCEGRRELESCPEARFAAEPNDRARARDLGQTAQTHERDCRQAALASTSRLALHDYELDLSRVLGFLVVTQALSYALGRPFSSGCQADPLPLSVVLPSAPLHRPAPLGCQGCPARRDCHLRSPLWSRRRHPRGHRSRDRTHRHHHRGYPPARRDQGHGRAQEPVQVQDGR